MLLIKTAGTIFACLKKKNSMKKLLLLTIVAGTLYFETNAQGIGGLLKKATAKDSTGKSGLQKAMNSLPGWQQQEWQRPQQRRHHQWIERSIESGYRQQQ